MQTAYTMSNTLREEVNTFLRGHNLSLLNQYLRQAGAEFAEKGLQTGAPFSADNLLYCFNSLLNVLDAAANERQVFESIKGTGREQEAIGSRAIEKVIAFVKASVNPESIFLAHHSITGSKEEYFDLIVVMPGNCKTSFNCYEQVLTLANIENTVINVSLHKAEVIEQQLKEGHIYYSISCNKNNLIYSSNTFTFPATHTDILKIQGDKATAAFNIAHKKAGSFLQGAFSYLEANNFDMATFMLQQGIELTVQGMIKALLGNCAKTHSLRELKKPLKRCAPEIAYLLCEDATEENRLLTLLEKAYLETRYSGVTEVKESDAAMLAKAAGVLHENAAALFIIKMQVLRQCGRIAVV